MKLLLDTHALAWWANEAQELSTIARQAIANEDNQVFVSAVSIYEAASKHQIGKWPEVALLLADVSGYLVQQRFDSLPLDLRHAERAGSLPFAHRDPFDRMLIAQALIDDLSLVSNDAAFDQFGVRRLW